MAEEEKIPPQKNPQEVPVSEVTKADAAKDEEISSSAPVAEIEQVAIINLQSEKEMEVHHHTHPGHHKKKWTDYFWEFLMLFFAVFCGFLAEYQLEHKIERDREKQYIHSIVEDLSEDTLMLSNTIRSYQESEKRNDTLIQLLSSQDVENKGSDLYYLGRMASRSSRLAIRDATYQQLKNSGGLRLIRNVKVSKAIIEYYNQLVFINYLEKIEDDEIMEYRKMAVDVFQPVLFNQIVIESSNQVVRPPGNPALLTYDPKIILRIAGMTSYIRNTRIGLSKIETDMRRSAKDLIQLIKKEYHLK